MRMTGLWDDVRLGVRGLRRAPGFAVSTVGTLALAIGAVAAVFSLVDSVLLSPLPFEDPEALVEIRHESGTARDGLGVSDGLYGVYSERLNSLDEIALHVGGYANHVWDAESERIQIRTVTPSFFRVLRVEASVGRTFLDGEGSPGTSPVAILSDGLWRSLFSGDPSVLGQSIDLDGVLREVVGVMPPGFGHPDREARVWLPLVIDPAQARPLAFNWSGVARLRQGSSLYAANAEVEQLLSRLPELFPDADVSSGTLSQFGLEANLVPLRDAVVGDIGATLWILLATVGFLLLIACANVANLALVRADGRRRESAVRLALGASRMQLGRWLLGESMVLGALGGAGGLLMATLALRASLALAPTDLPRIAEVRIDARVLVFTGVASLACALFVGLVPTLRHGADGLVERLRAHGSGVLVGRRRRSTLVVLQVALALVLLVGSGLLFRTFQALRATDPGFVHDQALTARLAIPEAEVSSALETADFLRQVRQRLEAQPGVEAAGFGLSTPLSGGLLPFFNLSLEDHPRDEDEVPIFASQNFVGEGYFEALGLAMREGRAFNDADGGPQGQRAVIVSESFANEWWPGVSPVGRRARFGFPGEDWHTIVGVVGDARYQQLHSSPESMVYWPVNVDMGGLPSPVRLVDIVIRTASDPLQVVPLLRREVSALNPRIPVANVRTMNEVFATASSQTYFAMLLLGAASVVALLLGVLGIHGVISYTVVQRTREIGVRMALGASGGEVRRMVMRHGVFLAGLGVVIGLVAAAGLTRLMSSQLYGVRAIDPVTFGVVAAFLFAVALVSAYLPAAQASKTHPLEAMSP